MTKEARYLVALQEEQLRRAAERSLGAFVRDASPQLEPETVMLPNWHIDLLCEHLEAVTAGQVRRLVINIPPRYMKSLITSVFWPAWEWIRHPEMRWVFASYAESLAVQHSLDRRTVIQSPWYQTRWGNQVQLVDQIEKTEFRNTRRGRMLATSVGGSVTGKGGNRIVVDDPHSPAGVESDAVRARVIEYFLRTLVTRLDDKHRGAIVVVMQRLHEADLAGTCLALGYEHLCLPAIAETRTTITFPRSGRVVTREPGEPLWAARETLDELAVRKRELGAYGFAGQYQQAPSPRADGIIKRAWWQYYDTVPPGLTYAQSWDLSLKGGPDPVLLRNLSESEVGKVLFDSFKRAMNALTIQDAGATRIEDRIRLRDTRPFRTDHRPYLAATKSIFNKTVGEAHSGGFELSFAAFLEAAPDVAVFAKNYLAVGFKLDYVKADGDLSNYTPDFIVRITDGTIWIIETKGREEIDVPQKMARLRQWCADATAASADDDNVNYRFAFVDQKGFEQHPPETMASLAIGFAEYQS